MDFILEERVEKARDLFRQGYNCSQSVFLAYNDLLGVESTLAATISGPLGGGMGRLRRISDGSTRTIFRKVLIVRRGFYVPPPQQPE